MNSKQTHWKLTATQRSWRNSAQIIGAKMSMLPRRKVETNEIVLLDALESIGIDNVQNILRLDEETLVIFYNYLGLYIDKLKVENEERRVKLTK